MIKWHPKVAAIKEAQNLKTLPLDDLFDKLLTHEIYLEEEEVPTKMGVAYKETSKNFYFSGDKSSDDGEDL